MIESADLPFVDVTLTPLEWRPGTIPTRRGVLDQILGLRKDQLAREPKSKTLPGWALWCSGARTLFALVLSLTASYVIGRPSAAIADRVGFHRLRGVKCCSHAARCRGTMIPRRATPPKR
jgi:hypothetical protein